MIYFPVYSVKLSAIAYNEVQECLMVKKFDGKITVIPDVPRNIFFLLLAKREEARFDEHFKEYIEDKRDPCR